MTMGHSSAIWQALCSAALICTSYCALDLSEAKYGTDIVNPHNFSYIHQPNPCQPEETVVFTVHSAVQNIQWRTNLRSTWATQSLLDKALGTQTKVVFMLGATLSEEHQMLVNYESERYEDIIQAGFIDSYFNNTYKIIYNFKWLSLIGCPNAKMIVKLDDDIMIHLERFHLVWEKVTKNMLISDSFVMGRKNVGSEPHRSETSKWHIPESVYPYKEYPAWYNGLLYFVTTKLAKQMYYLAESTPYMFTDDVFVGVLASRVPGSTKFDSLMEHYAELEKTDAMEDQKLMAFKTKETKVFFHTMPSSFFIMWTHLTTEIQI